MTLGGRARALDGRWLQPQRALPARMIAVAAVGSLILHASIVYLTGLSPSDDAPDAPAGPGVELSVLPSEAVFDEGGEVAATAATATTSAQPERAVASAASEAPAAPRPETAVASAAPQAAVALRPESAGGAAPAPVASEPSRSVAAAPVAPRSADPPLPAVLPEVAALDPSPLATRPSPATPSITNTAPIAARPASASASASVAARPSVAASPSIAAPVAVAPAGAAAIRAAPSAARAPASAPATTTAIATAAPSPAVAASATTTMVGTAPARQAVARSDAIAAPATAPAAAQAVQTATVASALSPQIAASSAPVSAAASPVAEAASPAPGSTATVAGASSPQVAASSAPVAASASPVAEAGSSAPGSTASAVAAVAPVPASRAPIELAERVGGAAGGAAGIVTGARAGELDCFRLALASADGRGRALPPGASFAALDGGSGGCPILRASATDAVVLLGAERAEIRAGEAARGRVGGDASGAPPLLLIVDARGRAHDARAFLSREGGSWRYDIPLTLPRGTSEMRTLILAIPAADASRLPASFAATPLEALAPALDGLAGRFAAAALTVRSR